MRSFIELLRAAIARESALGEVRPGGVANVLAVMTPEEHAENSARLLEELRSGRVVPVPQGDFYDSMLWKELRYEVLKERGRRCECCGEGPEQGATIQVDHIKPRSRYPHLELEKSNLQVLCLRCNHGKSNRDETDWRST